MSEEIEALGEAMNLLITLHRRGVLRILSAVLDKADEVTDEVVTWLSSPENTRTTRNAAAIYALMRELDPSELKAILNALNNGLDSGFSELRIERRLGILDILRYLNDPDVNRALRFILAFLKGMGASLQRGA
jgi:uncharacterized protein YjgD (DUF1641 family)